MRDAISQAWIEYMQLKHTAKAMEQASQEKYDWIIERFREIEDGVIVKVDTYDGLWRVEGAIANNGQILYHLIQQWGGCEMYKPLEDLEVVK